MFIQAHLREPLKIALRHAQYPQGINANGDLFKSVTYPFVLSLSKPVLSVAEGHEWIIFRGSLNSKRRACGVASQLLAE